MSTRSGSRTVSTGCRVLHLASVVVLLVTTGCQGGAGGPSAVPPTGTSPAAAEIEIKPTPFPERNEKQQDVYNTSGIVPIEDGRFLLVDNNTNDALLELRLTPEGTQAAPLALLPLVGLADKAVDDIEDLALAEAGGHRFVFATPSLSVKPGSKKKGKEQKVRPSSLLRIEIKPDGTLATDAMPGFRDWLVQRSPEIALAAENDPDFGGLNIEGLGWDAARSALLFGVRTPVVGHAPIVVPVRVKDPAGPWTEDNLELLPVIRLQVEEQVGDQGIRGMATGPGGKGFLLTVANATSDDQAGFSVYEWDGNQDGKVRRLPVKFAKKMKAEGLAVGTIGGKPTIVFIDDNGGFAVLGLDKLPAA